MRYVSIFFLTVMTLWSARVVADDLSTSKIANRKIMQGGRFLLAALAAALALTWSGWRGGAGDYLQWSFYPLFAFHVLLSVLAALILWYAEIWPAGDAKFFMLVSAALPLIDPRLRHFPHYLFLSLLTNIFIAAAFVVLGGYVASGIYAASPAEFFSNAWADGRERLSSLVKGRNPAQLVIYPFHLTFLFLMQQVLMSEFVGVFGRLFSRAEIIYFFAFMLWNKIAAVFKSRAWFVTVACCYLAYFCAGYLLFRDRLAAMLAAALVSVFKFSLLLVVGRAMLGFLMEKKDLSYAGAGELAPGMVLSAKETERLRRNAAFDGAFDDAFKDGLREEQIELLRDWLKGQPAAGARVEIVRGRPFALWIAVGAVISLLLGGNLASLFK